MSKVGIVRNILLLGILVVLLVIAYEVPIRTETTKPANPVCHAIAEDSIIWDCDYHDGAWWVK